MLDVGDVLTSLARYAETSRDLLLRVRPAEFAARIRSGKHHYLPPFQFVVISLAISGIAAFSTAAFVLVGSERELLFHLTFIGVIAVAAAVWIENLFVVALAKLWAYVLGISAPFTDLLDGYCYASVLFAPFIIGTEILILSEGAPGLGALVIVGCVQYGFFAYVSVVMTQFVVTHPRYRWRLGVGTFTAIVLVSLCAGALIVYIDERDTPNIYEANVLWNIDPSDHPTLRVWNVSRGADCTTCWAESAIISKGERIALDLYYHNSAARLPAVRPRLKLIVPDVIASRTLIAVVVSADNSPKSSSGVVVLTNDGQAPCRLVAESALWWPAQPDINARALPFIQTPGSLLSPKGLLLENIPAGCDYRGDVIAHLKCV